MNLSGSTKDISAANLNSIDAKRNLSGVRHINSSFDPYGNDTKKNQKSSKSSSKGINTSTNALLNSRRRLNQSRFVSTLNPKSPDSAQNINLNIKDFNIPSKTIPGKGLKMDQSMSINSGSAKPELKPKSLAKRPVTAKANVTQQGQNSKFKESMTKIDNAILQNEQFDSSSLSKYSHLVKGVRTS